MEKRIMCSGAGCQMCRLTTHISKDSEGKNLYRCSAYKDEHKKVYASHCEHFLCSDSRGFRCRDCERK